MSRLAPVVAVLAAFALRPATAAAGAVYRVAVTQDPVGAVAVAGGRVFWTTDGVRAAVFSSYLAGDRRRLLGLGSLDDYDRTEADLWASPQRVALQVGAWWYGPEDEDYEIVARASGSVSGSRITSFDDLGIGFERMQDVDGDAVLTAAERRIGGHWTSRPFIREFAAGGPRLRAVGLRVRMARDEYGNDIESRVSGPWVATLRRTRRPMITVYGRWSNRVAWRVRLPALRGYAPPYDRRLVWDLASNGTIAAALTMNEKGPVNRRQELGWAPPRGTFRRVTGAVALRTPFVLSGRALIYTRSRGEFAVQLYQRRLGGAARALTGVLPWESSIATDGRLLAIGRNSGGPPACVLAATLPTVPRQRWDCKS